MAYPREAYEMLKIPLWGLEHSDVSEVDPEAQRLLMGDDPRLRIVWDRLDKRFKVLVKMEPNEAACRLNGRIIRGWYCVSWVETEKREFLPINIHEIRAWRRRADTWDGVGEKRDVIAKKYDDDQADAAEGRARADDAILDEGRDKFVDRLDTSRRSSAVVDGCKPKTSTTAKPSALWLPGMPK